MQRRQRQRSSTILSRGRAANTNNMRRKRIGGAAPILIRGPAMRGGGPRARHFGVVAARVPVPVRHTFMLVQKRGGLRRIQMTTTSIDAQNHLAGPAGVNKTGPPLAPASANLQWPAEINQSFAISIRPLRFQGMQARLGPWSRNVQLWNGTNGMGIDVALWKRTGKVHPHARLRAGEVGCYDSHVRIWERIVQQNTPVALILEDDANLRYIPHHAQRLRQTFDELKRMNTPWDILYVGGKGTKSRNLSTSIAVPRNCNGLFAYCLTLQGAKLLLQRARPYNLPVDVLVAQLEDANYIKAVAIDPPLFYVVEVHSDTVHIK